MILQWYMAFSVALLGIAAIFFQREISCRSDFQTVKFAGTLNVFFYYSHLRKNQEKLSLRFKFMLLALVNFIICWITFMTIGLGSFDTQRNAGAKSSLEVKTALVNIIKSGDFKTYFPYFKPDEYEELARRISILVPTNKIGERGPWDRLAWINFDKADGTQYQLIISTRKSLNGAARATIQIKGKPDYITYYDADDIWKWLEGRKADVNK